MFRILPLQCKNLGQHWRIVATSQLILVSVRRNQQPYGFMGVRRCLRSYKLGPCPSAWEATVGRGCTGGSFMLNTALGAKARGIMEKNERCAPFQPGLSYSTSQLQHCFRALSHHRYKPIARLWNAAILEQTHGPFNCPCPWAGISRTGIRRSAGSVKSASDCDSDP